MTSFFEEGRRQNPPRGGGTSYRGRGGQRFHPYPHQRSGRETQRQFQRDTKCNKNSDSETVYVCKALPVVHTLTEKVLPFYDSQSVNQSRDSSSSYRVSKAQSAPSWETPALQKQLGEDHPGSMGVGNHTRLQNTFQSAALPAIPTKSLNSLSSRGSSHAAGDSEYAREACNRRGVVSCQPSSWFLRKMEARGL